jgi:hypothetical protein
MSATTVPLSARTAVMSDGDGVRAGLRAGFRAGEWAAVEKAVDWAVELGMERLSDDGRWRKG